MILHVYTSLWSLKSRGGIRVTFRLSYYTPSLPSTGYREIHPWSLSDRNVKLTTHSLHPHSPPTPIYDSRVQLWKFCTYNTKCVAVWSSQVRMSARKPTNPILQEGASLVPHLKSGHDCFIPYPFQFHYTSYKLKYSELMTALLNKPQIYK